MSRKHFVALAKVIAATPDKAERKRLCEEIGAVCAAMNSEFKWWRWRDACGVSE